MAQVLAASFGPDKLFQVMFPHKDRYPEDFVDGFQTRLYESYWDYSRVLMISYTTDRESHGEKEVTGMAEWQRVEVGRIKVWGPWAWLDPRRALWTIFRIYHSIRRYLWPNRAAAQSTAEDPNPMTWVNFDSVVGPFTHHFFTEPPYRRNHWILDLLAVDPAHQGQGFGRELAAWGVARAKSDELPAVVVAAEGKNSFYRNAGFKLRAGNVTETTDKDGNENPLAKRGVGGGEVLWTAVKEDEAA